MTTWAVIHNPTAGSFRPERLEAVRRTLDAHGVSCRLLPTGGPGHATALARAAEGVDTVVSLGGDGTLNEVLNGLLGREVPLAFLPGGTVNVMAHELGLPQHPVRALHRLLAGTVRPVRPGLVDGRAFLLMAGFGFDGEAVARVNPRIKDWLGRVAYGISALQALAGPGASLHLEGRGPWGGARPDGGPDEDGQGGSPWVIALRGRCYAGANVLHGRAGLETPGLELVRVRRGGLAAFLAGRFMFRRPVTPRDEGLPASGGVRVWSERPFYVQVDGELLGQGRSFQVGLSGQSLPFRFPPRG